MTTPDPLAAFVGDAKKVKAFLDYWSEWATMPAYRDYARFLAIVRDREAKLAAAEQERQTLLHELDVAVTKIEAAEAKLRAVEGALYKCPVCDGAGHVSRPPHVAGDVNQWSSSSVQTYPCRPCSGTGIVTRAILTGGTHA